MYHFLCQWNLQTVSIAFVIYLAPVVEVEALPKNKNVLSRQGKPKYSYPTPIFLKDLIYRHFYHKEVKGRNYYWETHPIFGFGVSKFLSYAAHFCKYETKNGSIEVVSVGCGNGIIEEDIIATYRDLFGEELNITLVDPRPDHSYEFKTVNDLIEKRAHVVRNCVLLIIFPGPNTRNDGYDIDAIRKLQPCSVLTLYEITGISGSDDFRQCLYSRDIDGIRNRYSNTGGNRARLKNYAMKEVVYREVYIDPIRRAELWNMTFDIPPGVPGDAFKMANLKRTD